MPILLTVKIILSKCNALYIICQVSHTCSLSVKPPNHVPPGNRTVGGANAIETAHESI